MYAKHSDKFELLAISIKEEQTDPLAFLNSNGYSFTGGLVEMSSIEAYGVSSIPHTFFIDRQGNVVDNVMGGMDSAEFEQRVLRLLSL